MSVSPGAVVAVDAGGTMIKGALVTGDGRFMHEVARPTPVAAGPHAVVATVQAVVGELLATGDDRTCVSEAGDALLGPVRTELAARITWRDPPPVRLSPLGGRAGLIGAAVLAWQRLARDGEAAPAAVGPHWADWGRLFQR